jgi:hypothetical protein
MLFTILVLLMQFRNILNDVKRRKKRKRRRKPQGENNEEKDTTHVTGRMRKLLWFLNFPGCAILFLLLKISWRSSVAFGSEDGKVKRSGLFEIRRR